MLIQYELDAIYRVNEPISSQPVTGHLTTPDFQGRGFLLRILVLFPHPNLKKYQMLALFCLVSSWIPKQKWETMLWFFIFHTIFTPDFRRDLHQLGMDGHVVVPWWVAWPELGCVILIDMYLPQILYICNVCLSYKNTTLYMCMHVVYIYKYM